MATVTMSEAATRDLLDRYVWIADRAGEEIAERYDQRIRQRLAGLADFPRRGSPRADLGQEVRSLSFERTLLIFYRVTGVDRVDVLRILSANQDIALLRFD